jgi:hypothetical protein
MHLLNKVYENQAASSNLTLKTPLATKIEPTFSYTGWGIVHAHARNRDFQLKKLSKFYIPN